MDPDGSNGDPEAEPMCHNWDQNGDPSVKMRNNYAIITPQTSHQMHPFTHKMRNLGVGRKRKMKTTGKKDMRGNRNTGIAKVGEDPSVIQNN